MKPGHPLLQDHEYKRRGTANIFLFVQPLAGWRHVKVTTQRKKSDFAYCMIDLATVHFPNAAKIHIVLDNLNTHSKTSILERYGETTGGEILSKIECHFTPKHASWLNVAEIEINVMDRQCFGKKRI